MNRAKDRLDIIIPQAIYAHPQSGRGDQHVYAHTVIPYAIIGTEL
jgi:hypothetical protein